MTRARPRLGSSSILFAACAAILLVGMTAATANGQGGLVVWLGCGDGAKITTLWRDHGRLVHALDVDPENVEKARRHIRSAGLYGPVSVDTFDGKTLPYADNLVNLLFALELGDVSRDEVMRVLAPGGAVLFGGEKITFKPWPEQIDQWTHHLHDAGGNAVARDSVVGPPRHLQWTAGPRWARSHGWTPSVSAMVSAGGRLFYICDETLTCVDATVPNQWALVARDAFSGVLLWKRPIASWGSAAISGTPGTGAGVTTGRFTMPPNVGKRLVAVGDTVYVTLGASAPVTALDAATGEQRRVYAETAGADEILVSDGRLIVSIKPPKRIFEAPPAKRVCAIDAESGRVLWKKGPFLGVRASKGQDPDGRLELCAGDGQVFVLTTDAIESIAADSGKRLWRIERPALPGDAVRRIGFAGMYEYLLTVLVYHEGVVLLAQPEPNTHHTYHTMPGTLYALDAKTGRQLWKHAYGGWGHCTQPDVFVIDGLVWTHVDAETEYGSVWGSGFKAKDSSTVDYRIQALELHTGRLRKELSTKAVFNVGHHHRCYRNKITERFLMSSRRGVEFVDLATGENQQHHWVRSGCLLGNLPCNGLLYVAPHPCGCYIEAKLTGFNALAAGRRAEGKAESGKRKAEAPLRLERGPAYGQLPNPQSQIPNPPAWPTYRHDARRTGATDAAVDADLRVLWKAKIGSRPSGVTVADGKLFVADVDAHTVHALNAADGQPAWQFTAGARVDSPPTLHAGRAIFGSADGRVYCLRAMDGKLAWRFDAAPQRRLVTSFDQLESPWPVHGSVLMHDDKCWFAAGRSSYLDGGIRLFALAPATGEVQHHETIYSADPKTGKMTPEPSANAMAGVLNDVLGTDGANVFIRQMNVSASLGVTIADKPSRRHLFSTGGYLDSSWFNRTAWKCAGVQTSGIMVTAGELVYGVEIYASRSRETVFKPAGPGYRLACYSLARPTNAGTADRPQRRAQAKAKAGRTAIWQQQVPIRITSMVRTAEKLFVAGSPDVVDPADPHGAWQGRKGGVLAVFDAVDGEQLAEIKLDAPPVWDGMAATAARLFIATTDGNVVCLGKDE
ncbi:MAG: PQQ-binding-like beta-propeller repeat protein [Candidatus Nealsonbacteria bacterium]|nr:PQQ-binding-like beta-propeller repeat protein [Candidatus Nealsonbacteria bacterium]